jgi:hypothetical protein
MNVFVPVWYDGYSSVSLTVSELSAVGTPTRNLWVSLGVLYTLLIILFAWGVVKVSKQNRSLRIAGQLMLIYGFVSAIWPFAPMHQREVLAAGGGTISDSMHIALAFISVLLMVVLIGFGAAAFGKKFRWYSIFTMLAFLLFGILTSLEAPNVNVNLPTPMIGVWERINIGFFLLWVIVLALELLKREKHEERQLTV